MLKHVTAAFLCIFFIGSIASCKEPGPPSAQRSTYNENILRYDVSAPFTSLNPTMVDSSGSMNIFPLLYSYLFVPNPDGDLEPDLATKWAYDPGTYTWTVHLRKDALFHNGQPVTSRDVRHSLEAKFKNDEHALFSLVGTISLVSDSALTIRLKKSEPQFLKKIWHFKVIPQANEGKIDYYNNPIGSGPFKFKYRKSHKEVCLVANEDYYDGRPYLEAVIFYYQPDREKAWTRLLSGQTDIAQEVSPKNYEMMKQYERQFYFDRHILNYYTILLYNTHDPLFFNPTVRLALSHAIDREYIVKNILRGYGRVAVGPMGVDSPFHNPEVKSIAYDPKKALRLLEEAGWTHDEEGHHQNTDGKPFEFTILFFEEYQIERKVAQYIRLCLNDLGIKVRLQPVPYHELVRRYRKNNDFQAVITEFGGAYRNPEWLRKLWAPCRSHTSMAGCFKHSEVQRLFQEAFEEKNLLKQKKVFYEIDAVITSLQPGAFLFHKTAIDVMSKRFTLPHTFFLTEEGISRLRYASLYQG